MVADEGNMEILCRYLLHYFIHLNLQVGKPLSKGKAIEMSLFCQS